jgi:hypothetical protein
MENYKYPHKGAFELMDIDAEVEIKNIHRCEKEF